MRNVFGIHQVTLYNRDTKVPYGTLKVLDSSSLSMSGELIGLQGGSSPHDWAVEQGLITTEMGLNFSQYDDFLSEVFLGKEATVNAAEASGSVSTLTNEFGALVNATNGIASVQIKAGSEADVKSSDFVLKAVGVDTVDVYMLTNVDGGVYADADTLKVNAIPLTIPDSGATVEIAGFGVELVGGSGVVALTVGDTASFTSRGINNGSMEVNVGGSSDIYPEFGALVIAQKRGSEELYMIDCYRCKAVGLPVGFTKNEWSTAEVTAKVFYDSEKDGIFSIKAIS